MAVRGISTQSYPPEQIRISYTAEVSTIVVAWATSNETARAYQPVVQYGPTSALGSSVTGISDAYIAWNITSPALHFCNMTGLSPDGQPFFYRVGNEQYGWSPVYSAKTGYTAGTWPPASTPLVVAVTGDMGIISSNATMRRLADMTRSGAITFSIHNGDLAYADDRQQYNDGSWADGILNDFYNMLSRTYSPILPLMFGVGNHETQLGDIPTCINGTQQCKGLAYVKRVGPTLPYWASGSASPFWYSYNVGPVHFVALSMEQEWSSGSPQQTWVAADLQAIDRAVTPWVVAYVHRPLYCSNNMSWPYWNEFRATYEPLFNGPTGGTPGGRPLVDVVLTAHVHCYERLWQVAANGTYIKQDYNGMTTPLYLLSGSAGCIEGSTPWVDPVPAWSAYRACEDVAYGFATLNFTNNTHMRTAFVDANSGAEVDSAWVVRHV